MNRRTTKTVLAVAVLCGTFGAFAEDALTETVSDDGKNAIRLWAEPLSIAVYRDGVCVVDRSPIGLSINGKPLAPTLAKPRVEGGAGLVGYNNHVVYKKRTSTYSLHRTEVDFGGWGVELRAFGDGVCYRFKTSLPCKVRVTGEKAGLVIPDAEADCSVYATGSFGCEEAVGRGLKAREITTEGNAMVYLPLYYRTGGKSVVVSETDVRDYPIWNLKRTAAERGVAFAGTFAKWPRVTANNSGVLRSAGAKRERQWSVREREDYFVETDGTRTYPWRTFVLVDEPSKVIESDLNCDPFARQAPYDFSWVKPGKVAWDWWNAFDNIGDPIGCTTKTYERFIDFASKHGVEYVIFDEGWSEKLNIWKYSPRVDVPHLIKYAAQRNVGIILWMAWAQVQGDEERVAEYFAKLGAKGFKVDFMDRGDADAERFLWAFAESCAKRKMLVDYHGAHRPTGLQHVYPNVINFEGVHGLEMMKFYRGEDMLGNDVRAVFGRMTAGPLDYTPGAMDNYALGTYPICKGWNVNRPTFVKPGSLGTRARQMAMLVVYEAPLQMLCDSPTQYEKNPECFAFMAKVPAVWHDVKALGGDPETYAALARKAPDGAWYAAGLTNARERDVEISTAFLGGGNWTAEIFRDAPDANAAPTHYVHETRPVKGGEALNFHMAAGGGFVVRLVAR